MNAGKKKDWVDKIITYFTLVFSLVTHTYLDVRIQTRLWPEMFRVTDGRIYSGYMKSDTPLCPKCDGTLGLEITNLNE